MRPTAPTLAALLLATLPAPDAAADEGGAADLPLEAMAPADREPAEEVAAEPTVRCRVDGKRARCGPSVYRWLLEHLPLASRALRALELGDYRIEPLPEGGFRIDDRAGATADGRYAVEGEGRLVVLAPGVLDVPVLPRIEGTGVIVVRYAPDPEEPEVLECGARVLFRVESDLLHRAAAPFEGVLSRVLRRKLDELIGAATALAEAVADDAWSVYQALRDGGEASAEELRAFRERFLLH